MQHVLPGASKEILNSIANVRYGLILAGVFTTPYEFRRLLPWEPWLSFVAFSEFTALLH